MNDVSSGPYDTCYQFSQKIDNLRTHQRASSDELFYYVGANVDSVKADIGLMLADIPVPTKVQEYAAVSMELKTGEEIFSAMVVYGFLNYENGCVTIPNKELIFLPPK